MRRIHTKMSQERMGASVVCRDEIELLRGRVGLLGSKDRLLMTMYLENGNSFYQIGKLAGVSETTIARRIERLTKKLIEGEYIICLQNREKFTRGEIAVARDHFLRGMSFKKIAKKRRRSFYQVRQTIRRIKQLINVTGVE